MLSLCDNVKLPVIVDTPEKKALYESTFKEIKGSFISTRKILYSIINEDKNSVNMEMLKMAYIPAVAAQMIPSQLQETHSAFPA